MQNPRGTCTPKRKCEWECWLSLHRGHPVNFPIQRTAHCIHVMPANDTNESMFGHRKFPCISLGSIKVPLALEASALTTEIPRFPAGTLIPEVSWNDQTDLSIGSLSRTVCVMWTSQIYMMLCWWVNTYDNYVSYFQHKFRINTMNSGQSPTFVRIYVPAEKNVFLNIHITRNQLNSLHFSPSIRISYNARFF